jgi:hypothetical protein
MPSRRGMAACYKLLTPSWQGRYRSINPFFTACRSLPHGGWRYILPHHDTAAHRCDAETVLPYAYASPREHFQTFDFVRGRRYDVALISATPIRTNAVRSRSYEVRTVRYCTRRTVRYQYSHVAQRPPTFHAGRDVSRVSVSVLHGVRSCCGCGPADNAVECGRSGTDPDPF